EVRPTRQDAYIEITDQHVRVARLSLRAPLEPRDGLRAIGFGNVGIDRVLPIRAGDGRSSVCFRIVVHAFETLPVQLIGIRSNEQAILVERARTIGRLGDFGGQGDTGESGTLAVFEARHEEITPQLELGPIACDIRGDGETKLVLTGLNRRADLVDK